MMRRALAAFCAALLAGWTGPAAFGQNFGIIDPGTVIGNPSTSPGPARPFAPAGMAASPAQWGAKANDASFDSGSALNSALAASQVPIVIRANETFYAGATINVPDRAMLHCEAGGTIKRHTSFGATDSRPLVKQSSTVGSSIEGCTIDLNNPLSGNWLAGLAPNGNTANVKDRDITIINASASGLDWNFADQGETQAHVNAQFDNIRIVGSGRFGAGFYGMRGGHANVIVESTGADGIVVQGSRDFTLLRPYVNKATPPPLLYNGVGTTFAANASAPRTAGRLLAALSTTSRTITSSGSVTFNFTLLNPLLFDVKVGQYVEARSEGTPTAFVGGNITAITSNSVTLDIIKSGGTGAHVDWRMSAETGMLIFRGYNDRVRIESPIVVDNRNAASDGIGIGENGIKSTTAATPPAGASIAAPVSMTFATAGSMIAGPGYPFTAVSMGNPFSVRMGGTVTMVTAGGVTASITDARGTTTTANDWILTSEPGDVTITDPIVYRAGLFGLDLDSNTHVIGGVVEETSQRGLMIGRDLGGRLHNATVTGLTIKNTGLPAGMVGGGVSEPQGITWGTTFPGLTVEIENVVLSATSVLDTRGVPLTALGMNVDLDHGRYNAVIVDTSAPLFGATKSYNTFGSNWPDPHLDGSPTALLLDQNMLVCYAGNTNLGRPAAANVWIEYRGGQYMWITWNVGVTDGTGCAGADNFAVSLPTPFIIGPWLRAPLLGDMVGGGVLSGFCDPGATACRVTLASALSTGQSLTLSGTLHVATP